MISSGSSVAAVDRTQAAPAPASARSRAVRVLWLTNIPLPAVTARAEADPINSGGWMSAGLRALARHGSAQVTCAARFWPAPPAFEEGGVRYVTLEGTEPVGGWRGVASAWRAGGRPEPPVREMQALLQREAPDVVHVHGSETPNAMAAIEAGEHLGIPVLMSIQGSVSACAPLFFRGLDRSDIARDLFSTEFLKGRGLLHAWRRLRSAAALERVALARAREAAGRTDWDRDLVMRANPEARYWLIDEVLRPEFASVRWLGGSAGPPVIVSVTSGAPYKGIDVLLRAFAALRHGWPDARLKVIGPIAGTPVWPAIRRLERRLGLDGAIEWTGPLSAAGVAQAMSRCAAYACASRIENSPNSVCEAMSVGAPVVAPDTGGVPSLIRSGVDGLLFPRGDATGLASAIDVLLADGALAKRIGDAAAERARLRHDPKRVATQLQTTYETLAGSHR